MMNANRSSFKLPMIALTLVMPALTVPAFGQYWARPNGSVPLPLDWSTKHVLYPAGYTAEQATKMARDPRVYASWLLYGNDPGHKPSKLGITEAGSNAAVSSMAAVSPVAIKSKKKSALNRDWSVSLGAGGVAQGMSPAKYTFDVNATPSCSNDFAVFPVSASTGSVRAHVVGTFSTTTQYSTGTTVVITVTPTGGAAVALTLTASTSSNTGTNFQVFATGTVSTNATTEATNLAAEVNRNLNSSALDRIVAVASTNTVTVYALTAGNGIVLSDSETLNNFGWGTVVAGTNGTQANIVGLNQLYSGSVSPLCTGLTNPEFIFSYASGVGPVATSPAISLNGQKITYVENDTAIGAILHVLKFGSGSAEHASCTNSGTALPTCATAAVIPGSTSGSTATDFMLPLGLVANATTGTDLYSSPFVSYFNDIAYVGDANGYLYSISGVFNGTPTHAGGNFPVKVNTAGNDLSSPVVDVGNTGNIFVGDQGGILYNYTSAGSLAATALTVGNTTAGGIRDSPIVDSTNAVGYAVTACDTSGDSHITQFGFGAGSLTAKRSVSLDAEGCGDSVVMYDPTPDNNYFTKGISSATAGNNGNLLVCYNRNGGLALGNFQFVSDTMAAADEFHDEWGPAAGRTCSPLTEFYGKDVADTVTGISQSTNTVTVTAANTFISGQEVTIAGVAAGSGGCTSAAVADINGEQNILAATSTNFTFTSALSTTIASSACGLSSATATGPTQDYLFLGTNTPEAFTFTLPLTGSAQAATATNTTSVTGGTSAMIIDNDSSSGQASSIYFGTLATSTSQCGTTTAAYCAVKLTQGLLQ